MESLSAPPLALEEPAVEASSGPSFPPAQQTWFQVAGRKHEAGRTAVQVDSLWMYEFWTPNPTGVTWVIVQDIDESDGLMKAWDPAMPAPHWVIENEQTGHVQLGHVVDAVTHGPASMASGHVAPWRYLCAVQRAMARAYGGDPCFTGQRCRNPFFAGARVWMRPDLPAYGLRELHASLEASGLWDPSPIEPSAGSVAGLPEVPTGVVATEGDRNQTIFDVCRLAAYRGEDHVAAAHDVLCIPPLPASEVEGIIRSVEGYMGRTGRRKAGKAMSRAMSEEHRRIQSERGKRGGEVRSDAQKAGLAQGTAYAAAVRSAKGIVKASRIVMLSEQGLTRRQIVAELGVSESSVKRALRAARADGAGAPGGGGVGGGSTPEPQV